MGGATEIRTRDLCVQGRSVSQLYHDPIKTLVAQEGIEPPAQGYEPYMLPLHHRAILAPLCGFEPPLHMNVHI